MSAPPDPPKAGSILFIIPCPPDAQDANNRPTSFDLEIPLDDLQQLVLRPVRWLRLIAWGVLNCNGRVLDAKKAELHDDASYDHLQAGAAYSFLPDQDARFSLMNLEHFRAKRRAYPTGLPDSANNSSAGSASSDDSADTRQNAALEERDGKGSVFSGYINIKKAQILPRRFARDAPSLHAFAEDRGITVKHYKDAQNRLTIDISMNRTWSDSEYQCFILATDPQFIRDEDVPQPRGPPLGTAKWVARPEPTGETYILQSPERVLHPDDTMRGFVRFNERARFVGDGPRPCPKAVNYIYAASMVELYRRPCADSERVLSRPLAVVPPPPRKRPNSRELMFEQLYGITHGAARRQAEKLQREEEGEARMRLVRDWRDGSVASSVPDSES